VPVGRVILAEYFTTEDSTLLLITREDFDAPESYELPIPVSQMRRFVVENFGGGQGRSDVSDLNQDEWHQEFDQLVGPLASWSDEGDTVWFVPHDILHYVPLHALKIKGCHLIDRNPVCYTPSASVMRYCHAKRKDRRETAAVFGDSDNDLSHAREEARNVAHLFGTTPYLGNRATKRAVRTTFVEAGDDLDIVHFACHGHFNESKPLESGIVLAAERTETQSNSASPTDVLTAQELLRLEMRVTLLTLSACETGINERRPGDELIGLTRSLIYAGAPSVVVSLWAVADVSTRMLMERFYQCLRSRSNGGDMQLTKAEALREAQRYVKGLTAQQVFEYYDERLAAAEPDAVAALELDRADTQALAGDLEPAIAAYSNVRHRIADTTGKQAQALEVRITRKLTSLQREVESTLSPDYEIKPFDHLYYWGPFILVGDWK
jgi:CHAT domain-containing protein